MKPQVRALVVLGSIAGICIHVALVLALAGSMLHPRPARAPVFARAFAPPAMQFNVVPNQPEVAPPFAMPAFGQQPQPVQPEQLQAVRGPMIAVRDYTITGPHTQGNLSVYLIHGADTLRGQKVVPLHTALANNVATIHAGGPAIDNRGQQPIFIQAGDIIKGGTQDRVVPYDQIVSAGTHHLNLSVFCVEAGRSGPRGQELSTAFSSASERLPGKRLHLAARYQGSQQDVWAGVMQTQQALSRNLGGSVQSPLSQTSLQLTLENRRVQGALQTYVDKLLPLPSREKNVIGYAVAINGEIQAADVYASTALFQDLWPQMLRSSAVAALAEQQSSPGLVVPAAEVVREFMNAAEGGTNCRQDRSGSTLILRQEAVQYVLFDTCDPAQQNLVLHRSFLAK
jgi:hypothetical protein